MGYGSHLRYSIHLGTLLCTLGVLPYLDAKVVGSMEYTGKGTGHVRPRYLPVEPCIEVTRDARKGVDHVTIQDGSSVDSGLPDSRHVIDGIASISSTLQLKCSVLRTTLPSKIPEASVHRGRHYLTTDSLPRCLPYLPKVVRPNGSRFTFDQGGPPYLVVERQKRDTERVGRGMKLHGHQKTIIAFLSTVTYYLVLPLRLPLAPLRLYST